MRPHLLALLALGALAPAAHADGLPVGNLDTTLTGVSAPGARFFAIPAGRDTVVSSVYRDGGLLQAYVRLAGHFTVPAVAQDGTTTGLSGDARTLVLVRPRLSYPQRSTMLAVLDASSLKLRRSIHLHGDFSVDAISPDGRRLYLIQYTSPRDPLAYAVRSLDVRRGRLDPGEIVDPHERDEKMNGLPMSRATSADGRWAYTLYDGMGKAPFIHALDTGARRARCIDLPKLPAGVSIGAMALAVRGGQLRIEGPTGTVAFVDRRTFAVSRRATAAARVKAPAAHDGAPWGWIAAGAAAAGLALLARRRYAAGTDSAASRAASSSTPTVP
jgi:hypothetical protein